MKKILLALFFFIVISSFTVAYLPLSNAQDASCDVSNVENACSGANGTGQPCQDLLNKCTSQINQALQSSLNATAPLQSKLDGLNSQIQGIKDTVANIELTLADKKKNIDLGYKNLQKQQTILDATIRDYYIKSYYNSPIVLFLSSSTASQFTQLLGYQRAEADRDKAIIANIAYTIQDLQNQQKQLQAQEANLTSLKANLDQQSAQLDKIVSGARAYQSTLSNQLSQLNSIQQQVLAAKLAGLNIPLFAYNTQGGCSSDINPYKDPGFSGTKFGFFTYGVPNRVGLNQYGALGRANQGQTSDQILKAYYNFDGYQNFSGITIKVNDGNGVNTGNVIWSGSLEDYVKRVYEVPSSWPIEALKAQAIAIRSYVLAATNNGANSICATQNCQVFQTNDKGGSWDQAVDDTSGQAMVQGGNPIKAWFSSTHGGYIHSSGSIGWSQTSWTKDAVDTPSGSAGSFSDIQSNAYDKSSPWFYCDWGSRSQYNGTAWLTSSDVADIVNVILLMQSEPSARDHLYQTDKPNPAGTDTWSADQVRSELSKYRTPFNSVSGISVSANFSSGITTSVNVTGDAGSVSISGSDFGNYFNLRAPSNIQIVGPLYNVETR